MPINVAPVGNLNVSNIKNHDIRDIKPKAPNLDKNFKTILDKAKAAQSPNPSKLTSDGVQKFTTDEIKQYIKQAKIGSPALRNSHEQLHHKAIAQKLDTNGMKIACKELARRFENQINSMLWGKVFVGENQNSNFAERMWSAERIDAIIDSNEELGEIGNQVYEELLEELKIKLDQNDASN